MALGAVLGAALTTPAARAKGLFVGGTDVVLRPGSNTGNRLGAPIDEVEVTEAGPGGVSSMSFVIEDPSMELSIAEGMDVRFHDFVLDFPVFYGWVQSFSVIPDFGQQGRRIEVTAIGVEAVLDWAKTTSDLTFPAGSYVNVSDAVQSIVANSTGLGPIRALTGAGGSLGDQAGPTGQWPAGNVSFSIPTGTSVREAVNRVFAASTHPDPAFRYGLLTVDFYFGLRLWPDVGGSVMPSDYTGETIVNAGGGTVSEDLSYDIDAIGVPRGIVVRGSGLAVVVANGTAPMGEIATLTDTDLTTIEAARAAGEAYLNSFRSGIRGSYKRTDRTPVATLHPGSQLTITDARAGLSAAVLRVMQIEKSFNASTREDWTIHFGGLPPSGIAELRRLTRSVLS